MHSCRWPSYYIDLVCTFPRKHAHAPSSELQVALGLTVVAAGMYAVRSLVLPYFQSAFKQWHTASRARTEEQRRREEEIRDGLDALRQCQVELKDASTSLAEAARAMKEQAQAQAAARSR